MITIYHVPGTRSVRVIWLCEELGLEYKVVPVDFSAEYRASAEWRKMNPVGKVPVMLDGDIKIFESGAMVQSLLDRYGDGRLEPIRGTAAHAEFLQWCWFAEATFARPLGEIVNHRREFQPELPGAIEEMQNRAWLCVEALEPIVSRQDYLVGSEFSVADIMMGYSLNLADRLVPREFPPFVAAYFDRICRRSGYQIAAAGTGPV